MKSTLKHIWMRPCTKVLSTLMVAWVFVLFMASPAPATAQTEPQSAAPTSPDTYSNSVQVNTILVTTQTGNGDIIDYPDFDNGEVTVAEVILAPGAATGWHQHVFPVYAYVLSGTLTVDYDNGTWRSFKAGEAIIEVVGHAHNGRAVGTETVKLIVFYTGIKDKITTIKVDPPK